MLLLWVYYSSQILFFGAEFTQVYANRFGERVAPADNAIAVQKNEKARGCLLAPLAVFEKRYVALLAPPGVGLAPSRSRKYFRMPIYTAASPRCA